MDRKGNIAVVRTSLEGSACKAGLWLAFGNLVLDSLSEMDPLCLDYLHNVILPNARLCLGT